nr:DUF2339 domain-containing protein [Pseudoxanthomonas indica]
MAGVLVLFGLAVLAVPVLLIIALVSISGLKQRVSRLEEQLAQARHAAPLSTATAAAQAAFTPHGVATAEDYPAEPVDDSPTLGEILQRSTPSSTSASPSRTAPPPMDAEPALHESTLPPPLPVPPAGATPPPLERPIEQPSTPEVEIPRVPRPPLRSAPSRPDPITLGLRAIKHWFTVGNVPVKIGMLVLLAGVAALLKYAADQGYLNAPIEARLAAVAACALGALVFAWRKRESHPSFALTVQGGAIGILLLTVFAAFKRYDLLEAMPAFALSVVLIFGAGALAVLQNSKSLAVFAILAGFLAPIWLSTGSGNHVALFSYYAVLNAAILAVAWFKPWRVLNLLGFVFTFGIGTLWGVLSYDPAKYASTEPFLLLFFGFYLLIPLLYARRLPEGRRGLVDACLLFGTPLIAFALQAALLEGARMPLAYNALGLAALYVVLAVLLRRRGGYEALVPAYAVLGVGFATLSVPLALSARATASVFALEGAALIWLGLRQERRLPLFTGSLLQLLAALAFLFGDLHSGGTPVANPVFMAALIIALAGLSSAWNFSRQGHALALPFYLWGLGWWLGAGVHEIGAFITYTHRADALLAFAAVTGWLAAEVHRRHPSTALAMTTLAALIAAAPLSIVQAQEHAQPFAGYGALAWLVYAVLGVRSLICLRRSEHALAGWAQFVWLLVWPLALSLLLDWVSREQHLAEGWRVLAMLLPWLIVTALGLFRWPWLAAPLGERFDGYRSALQCVQFAVLTCAGVYMLLLAGSSAPLPWVPVVNPLELAQLGIIALLAYWLWSDSAPEWMVSQRTSLLAIAGFSWVSVVVLRAVHHWGGMGWDGSLIGTSLAQTSLTLTWSVLGVIGWVLGSRRGQRSLWLAGAVLMGVVLVKLLLIDRGNLGDALGIASFIAYGVLCTVVGYLAPVPPRMAQEDAQA